MTVAERFKEEAAALVASQLQTLRSTLTFADALLLPVARTDEVVVAGKEVALTIYRQSDTPLLGQVLVTAQIARHALGGVVSFHIEKGLVFSQREETRDATDKELIDSGA